MMNNAFTPTTTSAPAVTPSLANAIRKASKLKCHVRPHPASREYDITTPDGHLYIVRMRMHEGLRYAFCNCVAGSNSNACYHIIGAAIIDSALTGYPLKEVAH